MKRLLLLLVILCIGHVQTQAQPSWPIVPNCMGELRYPIIQRGRWDFPGVIITSNHPEGVHALRADRNVEYYIALEADDAFPSAGRLSPDGKYFAYPIGHTTFRVNTASDDVLSVDYLRIIRTDGLTGETYRFDASDYVYTSISSRFRAIELTRPIWVSNDRVYYPDGRFVEPPDLISFRDGERISWTQSTRPGSLRFTSPDGTRAFADDRLYDITNDQLLPVSTLMNVAWFPDSSAFFIMGNTLSIFSREGRVVAHSISRQQVLAMAVAPDGRAAAFWDTDKNLFLVDLDEQVIYDLCFQTNVDNLYAGEFLNLAWSPDSRHLAFIFDRYLILLNTRTFENRVIAHTGTAVMGWASLDGETVQPVAEGLRRPPVEPTSTPTIPAAETPVSPISPTALPTNIPTPQVSTCTLSVTVGANLRSGPGVSFDRIGSAAIGFVLEADARQFNDTDYFFWWRLTTSEWIREDFVEESPECEFLPEIKTEGP